MKKNLVWMIAAMVFFSCKKDEKIDPQLNAFATFQGKYLVCDSIVTTANGTTTTQVIGKGKGADITFGLYGNLEIFTTPTTNYNYQFESPDKVYYWQTNYDSNQFYTIQSMGGNKIVLLMNDTATGNVLVEYFTAE